MVAEYNALNGKLKFAIFALAVFLCWKVFLASKTITVGDLELTYVEKSYGSGEQPLLIVLHGAGADERNLLGVVKEMGRPVRAISIRGPARYGRGYTWAEGSGSNQAEAQADYEQTIARVAAAVAEAAREFSREHPAAGKPALLGFSMGAKLGTYIVLHHPDTFSKAFLVSGSLEQHLMPQRVDHKDLDIVFYHGKSDSVIGYAAGNSTYEAVKSLHRNTSFVENPGGHSIPASVIADIAERL